ncbi:MAG: type II toxin-antitoxin system VapC family toxin [Planctomycetes bacterium]|nr:type II toxin-antitoxin system VapC family toxin [Planctomycetota bacterium]
MTYVVDASVAVKWVLKEIDSDKADALRNAFRSAVHDLISPSVFTIEAAHALTRAERQKRIAVGEARKLLIDVLTTPPRIVPFESLLLQALDISSNMRIGVYDCLYVALAEQVKCELVTADTTMVNALRKDYPFIRALATMP